MPISPTLDGVRHLCYANGPSNGELTAGAGILADLLDELLQPHQSLYDKLDRLSGGHRHVQRPARAEQKPLIGDR